MDYIYDGIKQKQDETLALPKHILNLPESAEIVSLAKSPASTKGYIWLTMRTHTHIRGVRACMADIMRGQVVHVWPKSGVCRDKAFFFSSRRSKAATYLLFRNVYSL